MTERICPMCKRPFENRVYVEERDPYNPPIGFDYEPSERGGE